VLPPFVALFLAILTVAAPSRAWSGHHRKLALNTVGQADGDITDGIRDSEEPADADLPTNSDSGRNLQRLLTRGSTFTAWFGMALTGSITIMWGLIRYGPTILGPVRRMPGLISSAGVIGLGWGFLACCLLCVVVRLAFQSFNGHHEWRSMMRLKRLENENARLLLRELMRLLQDTRRLKLGPEATAQLLGLVETIVRSPRNVDYRSAAFELGLTSEEARQIVPDSREGHVAEPSTSPTGRRRVSLLQLRARSRGRPT
jgi:hypothetical protein